MSDHPPKPERNAYRSVRGSSTEPAAIYDANGYHNACLEAAEAHYESRLAEHRQALKELVETLEATRFIGGERTGKTHLAAALEAARSLLEGESNE